MNITIFDAVLMIIALSVIIKVTVKGFVAEFFSMAAFFAAFAAALHFYRPLAMRLKVGGLSQMIMQLIAFFMLFIAVFVAVKLLQMLIATAFQNEVLRSLDHALGFFLGMIESYIIIVIIVVVLQLQPFFNVNDMLGCSEIVRALTQLPLAGDDVLQIIRNGI